MLLTRTWGSPIQFRSARCVELKVRLALVVDALAQRTEVVNARDALDTGLLVEQVVNLIHAHARLADEVEEAGRKPAPAPDPGMDENVLAGLELLAGRLEDVADLLENRTTPS